MYKVNLLGRFPDLNVLNYEQNSVVKDALLETPTVLVSFVGFC